MKDQQQLRAFVQRMIAALESAEREMGDNEFLNAVQRTVRDLHRQGDRMLVSQRHLTLREVSAFAREVMDLGDFLGYALQEQRLH